MSRRLFIGDVHGCIDELDDLLDRLSPTADDEIWFVGDLVNKGPDSAEVVRRARSLGASTVLGNHDLHALGVLDGDRELRRKDELTTLEAAPDRDELDAWLRTRPLVVEWPDLVLVHAALHPAWHDLPEVARPLEAAIAERRTPWKSHDLGFLTRARHCDPEGHRPENDIDPPLPYAPWDQWYAGTRRVVFGHWALRGLVQTGRVVGLDTGCVYGGALTAWIAETDEVISVPSRREYVPVSD